MNEAARASLKAAHSAAQVAAGHLRDAMPEFSQPLRAFVLFPLMADLENVAHHIDELFAGRGGGVAIHPENDPP